MKGIKIQNIKEIRWEFFDVIYLKKLDLDIQNFMSDINFHLELDEVARTITFFFYTKYGIDLKEDKRQIQMLRLDVEVEFFVENHTTNFFTTSEEEKLSILSILLGITISTTRGIIYANTKGHRINKLILPIIDPRQLLQIKLEKEEKAKGAKTKKAT